MERYTSLNGFIDSCVHGLEDSPLEDLIPPKLIYRFNATTIKISVRDSCWYRQDYSKICIERKIKMAKMNFKKDKVRTIGLLDFKMYYTLQ